MCEILALCVCTSCLSCVCCFVTGVLCTIPKLLQICNDLDACKTRRCNGTQARRKAEIPAVVDGKRELRGVDNSLNKENCKCAKKVVIHTPIIKEEANMCCPRQRDGSSYNPQRIDEDLRWK